MYVQLVVVLILASSVLASDDVLLSSELRVDDLLKNTVKPLKVLLINGYFPGHLFPIVALGEELVRRGHDVTLCSTVMEGSNLLPRLPQSVGVKFLSAGADNLTQKGYDDMHKALGEFDMEKSKDLFIYGGWTSIKIRQKIDSVGYDQFDIIICDYSVAPLAVYYSKLNKKVVVFSSLFPMVAAAAPDWPHPVASSGLYQNMSFLERLLYVVLQPLVYSLANSIFSNVFVDEKFKEVIQSSSDILLFPGTHVPIILTTVPGFDMPRRKTALMHFVGPLITKASAELSESLKEWLVNKPSRSVIYISMGTTGFLTPDDVDALVNGIMRTDYDVVWALRSSNRDVLDQIYVDRERFYIAEWVSQKRLLKHEAIALAILHCGMNGAQEALSNAVPIICIPHHL